LGLYHKHTFLRVKERGKQKEFFPEKFNGRKGKLNGGGLKENILVNLIV
jgi:hypothetical protein